MFFLFLIVKRRWPNFVCKGRRTSSVVWMLLLLVCLVVPSISCGRLYTDNEKALIEFEPTPYCCTLNLTLNLTFDLSTPKPCHFYPKFENFMIIRF